MTMPDVTGLPDDPDTLYADDPNDPLVKQHQIDHGKVHKAVKALLPNSARNPLTGWLHLDGFGAVGDDSADDNAAVAAAFAAAKDGDTVYVPAGKTYRITAAHAVPVGVRVFGPGTLHQTGTDVAALILSSRCTVEGVRITGPGSTVTSANSWGIGATGTNAAPLTDITIRNTEISGFQFYGIRLKNVDRFTITGNYVHDCWYALIMLLGCSFGKVNGNTVSTATISTGRGGVADDCYGIAMTYDAIDGANARMSTDIVCSDNLVMNIETWEGIDTHAGQRLTISNNEVYRCRTGIGVVPGAGVVVRAPRDVIVIGNTVDSMRDTGDVDAGISFAGKSSATVGVADQYGTGCIVGNTVRRHGLDSNRDIGAMYIVATQGLVVSGNRIDLPCRSGIVMFHTNDRYTLSANTIIEVWTDNVAANPTAIVLRSGSNVGLIVGNTLVASGEKTATTKNARGLDVAINTATLTTVGDNDFTAATNPYWNLASTLLWSAYNAPGRAQAAAIVSPTADVAALKTAVDALRTVIKNVGITA